MRTKYYYWLLSITASVYLSACSPIVPPTNIALAPTFWQQEQVHLVVANTPFTGPRITLSPPAAAHSPVMRSQPVHLHRLQQWLARINTGFYQRLRKHLVQRLRQRGMTAVLYTPAINSAALKPFHQDTRHYPVWNNRDKQQPLYYTQKDFRPLRYQFAGNYLLLLSLRYFGLHQQWQQDGQPTLSAACDITGQLVKLSNNRLLWRYHTTVTSRLPASIASLSPLQQRQALYTRLTQVSQQATANLLKHLLILRPTIWAAEDRAAAREKTARSKTQHQSTSSLGSTANSNQYSFNR